MKRFGDTMRRLMDAKGISGVQLSGLIGMTPTSISRILNGQSRPRQLSLTRIMNGLCVTKEEEQQLLRAYPTFSDGAEETIFEDEKVAREERERAERFLEVKAQSIAFKRSVARELDKAGISYTQDYCEGIYVTDFLIEKEGKRIALECKFNVHRDFEKTRIIAVIIRDRLRCDEVFVVVPFIQDTDRDVLNASGVTVFADQDLVAAIR
jgi:transcriptional regulator with XRE-family HTH domain